MNLEQMKARVAAILLSLEGLKAKEGEYSDEEVTQINDLSAEFDTLRKKIEATEKIDAVTAQGAQGQRKVVAAAPVVQVGEQRIVRDPKAGFQSSGEFYRAVIQAASSGNIDKRLTLQGAGAQEKIGEDGGFLIPVDFRQEIQKKVMSDDSLLPRTQQFKTTSNLLELPTSEVAPWDSSAGIQAYWEGESDTHTETKGKFGLSSFRLNKLTALVKVTDELLDDAAALESWINANAPEAMVHKVNKAILSGSGVGMPQGILNSGFKFKVDGLGAGQAADTIVYKNVNSMLARLLPMSIRNAIWICHPQALEQLRLMSFDPASESLVPIYLPGGNVAGAPFGTLLGLPIMPMMGGVSALGDEGDIILADLKYYYSVAKTTGIKTDISTHVYFKTDESLLKFQMRLAGSCPYKAPVVTEKGSFSMSGLITLGDRTGS